MVTLRGEADESMKDESIRAKWQNQEAKEARNDIEHFLFALSKSFFFRYR